MTGNTPISDADLHSYVDGQLPPERQRLVEAWLVDHPQDAERIAGWSEQMQEIREAFSQVLDEPVPAKFTAVAGARSFDGWRMGAIAASIALAFAIGTQASAVLSPAGLPDTILLAGLDAHILYTPEKLHPVEVGADSLAHLQKWLTNRVGLPVQAPDLSASGLNLLGGRLVSAGSMPSALLMYETEAGERYTVLVTRSSGQVADNPDFTEKSGISAMGWSQAGFRYVLSGPANAGQLEALKDRISDPV